MNSTKLLLGGLVFCALFFFGFILKDTIINYQSHDLVDAKLPKKDSSPNQVNSRLLHLIKVQNETIHELERKILELSSQNSHSTPPDRGNTKALLVSPSSRSDPIFHMDRSKFEDECEMRYGLSLVQAWQKHKETWCEEEGEVKEEDKSRLICYPFHQTHKKLDGRGPDLFCEAYNFVVDFSKVQGEAGDHKPPLGAQYLHFAPASLASPCQVTSHYNKNLFMPHQALQFRTFVPNTRIAHDVVEEKTTYLLARDEDCENAFHATADFMNFFLISRVLDLDLQKLQILLFDLHPDGPFLELIQKAFSPSHKPTRYHIQYKNKKVLFKRVIFHLESPAGLIFPKVSRPDPMRCFDTSLFQAYRRHVLKMFNLLDRPPPPIPTILFILRKRSARKNVGRVIGNEGEVLSILKEGTLISYQVLDLASLSYTEQLTRIRDANILIGAHGAGLMNLMFSAEESVVLEIHPSYRQDRHFRHAARLTNKHYLPIRCQVREKCVGTSDTLTVPLEEFRYALDGAVRLARSFDGGLAECGLVCPKGVLALDKRLDGHYTGEFRKGRPVDTHFPCG